MKPIITYTITDEAPALATSSFLPIVKAFSSAAGIEIETKDISLASRVLSQFPDFLSENQRCEDALALLGEKVKKADANVIKLPNISASIPQLKAVIAQLQQKGFTIPNYPDEAFTEKEIDIKSRYDKVKGSAVNPVLREGNSDRRAPLAVKNFAKKNPHSMGVWSADSKSHVASMDRGDFYGSEKSVEITDSKSFSIQLKTASGEVRVLKSDSPLLQCEIIDTAVMSKTALVSFLETQVADAKAKNVLFSIHMKATMMKVSDPIIFGHAVKAFFKPLFDKHASLFETLGVNTNNGFGDLIQKIESLPVKQKSEIESDIISCYKNGPDLAMVNSDLGITNLHVPSDVIIDASMPAAIRSSGQMWNRCGQLQDMKAIIPDRSYAGIYQAAIEFCKKNGAFDPATMGTVSNVGLMAQKAEEYGSHDKTFEISCEGVVEIVDNQKKVLLKQAVNKGDLFRMCQAKDAAVKNWIELAVERSRLSNTPAVFWLDDNRAHDRALIKKVECYLAQLDTDGLEIFIMSPIEATLYSMERCKCGKNTISVTGNVLRDYLTDLFPILELGTSAKMLSIVPLMNGGGLFETGAGGSAPKHVQQFLKEGHLRWDSLGEFLALAVSYEHLGRKFDNSKAIVLADTLNIATDKFLKNNKSPSRKVNELDNRGSHYYLSVYWAEALSVQNDNLELQALFTPIAKDLVDREDVIVKELLDAQGVEVELGGYYLAQADLLLKAMRPSVTFNKIIDNFNNF